MEVVFGSIKGDDRSLGHNLLCGTLINVPGGL